VNDQEAVMTMMNENGGQKMDEDSKTNKEVLVWGLWWRFFL